MVGEEKLKQISKKVLGLSQADQTEVLLFVGEHGLTRFANSQIHQNVAGQDLGISVRVVFGKRIGVASGNSFEESALKNIVRRAEELAQNQKEDPNFISLPLPKEIPKVESLESYVSPEGRANALNIIIKKSKAQNIVASGAYDSSISEVAIANSHGVWAYHAASSCDLSTILMGRDSTGFAAQIGKNNTEIDAEQIAENAINKVLIGKNPKKVSPGEWDVILEPQAVNEMMAFFAWLGPNVRIYHEQASFFTGKLGQKVLGGNITIADDPLDKGGFPMPFDFEGYPKKRLEIIKNGVLENIVYDSYYAGKYKTNNTGHALPAPNTVGPIPTHLKIIPGKKSRKELIKGVKKGLLLTRLWYVRVLNPRSLNITGMTRDGTFLVENGEIVGGVKNLRFNQSIPEALNNVVEIENKLTLLSSFETELGSNQMPALHIKGWNFTSGTEF